MRDIQVIPISEYFDEMIARESIDQAERAKLKRRQDLMHERKLNDLHYRDRDEFPWLKK